MSFSRISFLALALAAGLAAPASATTLDINFRNSTTTIVDTGTFIVPAGATPIAIDTFSFSFSLGTTVLKFSSAPTGAKPSFNFIDGAPVLLGTLQADGSDETLTLLPGSWLIDGERCILPDFADEILCFRTLFAVGTYAIPDLTEEPAPSVIPLPATAALLPLGLMALGALRRRKAG
jgi:MYXO-CTERM domain-containing protein